MTLSSTSTGATDPAKEPAWSWSEAPGAFEMGARTAHRRAVLNGIVIGIPTALLLAAVLDHLHYPLATALVSGAGLGLFVVVVLYAVSRLADGAGRRVGIVEINRLGLAPEGVLFVGKEEKIRANWADLKPIRVGSYRGAPFLAVVVSEGPVRTVEGPRMVALPSVLALALLDHSSSPAWGISPEERQKLRRGGAPPRPSIPTP